MHVAVTSSDSKHIDQHFGKAERFLLYEVDNGKVSLVGEVKADAYCNWSTKLRDLPQEQFAEVVGEMRDCAEAPPPHRMMPEKLAAIVNALGECRVVVTAMIGEAPQAELEWLGFTVFTMQGEIVPVLTELEKVL